MRAGVVVRWIVDISNRFLITQTHNIQCNEMRRYKAVALFPMSPQAKSTKLCHVLSGANMRTDTYTHRWDNSGTIELRAGHRIEMMGLDRNQVVKCMGE